MRRVYLLLSGVGNVGQRFLELIERKEDTLRSRLGLELVVLGVADSGGAAAAQAGLFPVEVIRLKRAGLGVSAYRRWGQPGLSALDLVATTQADLFLEASPANLVDGQPALACIEMAMAQGMDVVTANKAPLVHAFPRLMEVARERGVRLGYDATVAGGLPAVNLGRRDLAVADIDRLEGVLNLTTNYILTRMADYGLSYEAALADAREAGHAETDPSLDVEGWDAASKLIILANSVLGFPATLQDVAVQGILDVTPEMLGRAAAAGKRIKLLATAERDGRAYRLTVHPRALEASHPLAGLTAKQMGIVYHTDICGILSASIVEDTPIPTAAAMLRDVVLLYADERV
jgi:homoserine dehydrogenase